MLNPNSKNRPSRVKQSWVNMQNKRAWNNERAGAYIDEYDQRREEEREGKAIVRPSPTYDITYQPEAFDFDDDEEPPLYLFRNKILHPDQPYFYHPDPLPYYFFPPYSDKYKFNLAHQSPYTLGRH